MNNHLTNTSAHLTEDQIDDHLIGDLAPEAAAHLTACSLCANRIAEANAPIAGFSTVAQAWSERRSATLPLYVPTAVAPRLYQQFAAAAVALAVLSVTLGGHLLRSEDHRTIPQTATVATANSTSVPAQTLVQLASSGPTDVISPSERIISERISRDNRMLQDVDTALDPSTESPASLVLDTTSSQPTSSPTLQD